MPVIDISVRDLVRLERNATISQAAELMTSIMWEIS